MPFQLPTEATGALGGASVRPELRLVPPEERATASEHAPPRGHLLRFRKQSTVDLHCQQDSALSQRAPAKEVFLSVQQSPS